MKVQAVLRELVDKAAKAENMCKKDWCESRMVSYGTLLPCANGKRGMTIGTLYQWCELLGIEPWKVVYAANKLEAEDGRRVEA